MLFDCGRRFFYVCKWAVSMTWCTSIPKPMQIKKNQMNFPSKVKQYYYYFIHWDRLHVVAVAPHARHDCDLFATYVAFWWLSIEYVYSKRSAWHAFSNLCVCMDRVALNGQPPALATLFIKCKCIYVKFNSLCGFELLLMIWFTYECSPRSFILLRVWM